MTDLRLVENEKPKRDPRLSPVALTFEAEIKRAAAEKGLPIERVMAKLAAFTGLSESQLYNYRTGKTGIPADLIPELCRQFHSRALAMAVLNACDDVEDDHEDAFDLTRFCSRTVRDMLAGGEEFLDAFDDGHIDGHELTNLSQRAARISRDSYRLLEVARSARRRNQTIAPAAA